MKRVFICHYNRTAIGRYGGCLATVRTDDLACAPLVEIKRQLPEFDLALIDDVILGCANQSGEDNRNVARMASLLADYPQTVGGVTFNRLCGSGMEAVIRAYHSIAVGQADCVVAGGVEGMSRAPYVLAKAKAGFDRGQILYDTTMGWRFVNQRMHELYGTDTMPQTADHVAREFNISRADQDKFSYRSHCKAIEGRGFLAQEITPVRVQRRKQDDLIIDQDEHPRADTSLEGLAKLRPLYEQGSVTAGNASGINDGAAAMIVASEQFVAQAQLTPLAEVLGGASIGVEPRIMGIGPLFATQKLLAQLKLDIAQFSVIELNEAFAAQALAVLRGLNIEDEDERVNRYGGAIALGHPLGMSGARLVGTTARQLHAKNQTAYGLACMCIGVGQGIAIALRTI